jgi:hypothetical protein
MSRQAALEPLEYAALHLRVRLAILPVLSDSFCSDRNLSAEMLSE